MEMWEGSKRKQQGYIRAVRGACGAAHCHPGLAGPSVIIDTRLPEMFLGWSGGHERPHMGCPSTCAQVAGCSLQERSTTAAERRLSK